MHAHNPMEHVCCAQKTLRTQREKEMEREVEREMKKSRERQVEAG